MTYVHAIIYGLIQGLSEFLPVSSSGHLALLPQFFNIQDPGVAFDLFMHVGTALAVLIYFHKKVFHMLKKIPGLFSKNKDAFTFYFAIASFATFVLVFLLKGFAEEFGRQTDIIAINLIVFGFLLLISDRSSIVESKKFETKSADNLKAAILIGLSQAIAIFPGVSRSGITISTARFLNYSKNEASSFSFLLSLPLIFGGMLFKAKEFFETNASIDLNVSLVGLLVSFIVGFLTIHFFLKMIQKVGLKIFFYYRLFIAICLLYFM